MLICINCQVDGLLCPPSVTSERWGTTFLELATVCKSNLGIFECHSNGSKACFVGVNIRRYDINRLRSVVALRVR